MAAPSKAPVEIKAAAPAGDVTAPARVLADPKPAPADRGANAPLGQVLIGWGPAGRALSLPVVLARSCGHSAELVRKKLPKKDGGLDLRQSERIRSRKIKVKHS